MKLGHPPYTKISEVTDRVLLAELSSIHDFIRFYTNRLVRHKIKLIETIQLIEVELHN